MNTATDQTPQFTTANFRNVPRDSPGLFIRGLLFGAGGALLGLILYSAVGIMTGLAIGYVSLAVGFIVGKAVLMGSRGCGGRRYQVAALLLTYGSVSLSAVPIALSELGKQPSPETRIAIDGTAAPAPGSPVATPVADRDIVTTPSADNTAPMGFAVALGMLVFLGLASPFLGLFDGGFSGVIGLVILAVGLQIAWKLTAAAGPTPAPAADAR
jgi:hypothetical protein